MRSLVEDLFNVFVSPKKRGVVPGDAVIFTCDGIGGDVPLTQPHPNEALEHEAFTGRSNLEATGWIRKDHVCLVIAVVDDHAFVLGRPGNGWGWVKCDFLTTVLEYSRMLEAEATEARRQAIFSGQV